MKRFEQMVEEHLKRLYQEKELDSTDMHVDMDSPAEPLPSLESGDINDNLGTTHDHNLIHSEHGEIDTMTMISGISTTESLESPFLETATRFSPTNPPSKRSHEEEGEIVEDTSKRPKQPKKVSGIPCTCAISNNCRHAAQNNVSDCRTSLAPFRRKQKPKSRNAIFPIAVSTKQQAKVKRNLDEMSQILSLFRRARTSSPGDLSHIFTQMRQRVQQLPFSEVHPSSEAILKSRFLDAESGFPAIANSPLIPWDIKLDVDVLRLRWEKGDIETGLDRGLITKCARIVSRSFDPAYKYRVSPFYAGEGNLRNGQWFPWQLSAIRDGAHGEVEAGVSGREGLGAFSIVLSSSHRYADRDQGETIYYYGTYGKNGKISHGTNLLLDAHQNGIPIRVLRSSKLPAINKYRPAEGLRYDGLYKIESEELMEESSSLYRFKLQRVEGQTPIRYSGPEARPTPKEVEEFRNLQKFASASRPKKSP
nr:hypothetical protein CPAG_06748 [Coccidioides posadasii RMSCC 3488]